MEPTAPPAPPPGTPPSAPAAPSAAARASAPHVWTLRAGADKRFRAGHPWVYSNELAHSPRGAAQRPVAPGDPVELRDAAGRFLARGYGHPGTLIAFRALSRDPAEAEPWGEAALLARLRRAAALRHGLGLGAVSHRLVFGEADDLPGLVVDRYRLAPPDAAAGERGPAGIAAQVLAVQAHTAGAERLQEPLLAALEALVTEEHAADPRHPDWAHTAVVLRNDAGARRLEGLPDDAVRVARPGPGLALTPARVLTAPVAGDGRSAGPPGPAVLQADLLGGQKTGLFLDQAANLRLAAGLLAARLRSESGSFGTPGSMGATAAPGPMGATAAPGPMGATAAPLRILDLFAYVGAWGAALARVGAAAGRAVEVTVVDASAPALALAVANVTAAGGACTPLRADVLADAQGPLAALPPGGFDVVVADPPAFIKGRKAWHTGRAAYVKLNTAALRWVRPGGLLVTCSCSQLLSEADFLAVLDKAAARAGTPVRWIARGGQAPDHPVRAGFPEGDYLKARIGVVG